MRYTKEQLLEGVDLKNLKKTLPEALKTNEVLRNVALASFANKMLIDASAFAESTMRGEKLAGEADLDNFLKVATEEDVRGVEEALGIKAGLRNVSAEYLNERVRVYEESGDLDKAYEIYRNRANGTAQAASTVQTTAQTVTENTAAPINMGFDNVNGTGNTSTDAERFNNENVSANNANRSVDNKNSVDDNKKSNSDNEHITIEEFSNREGEIWNNVDYNDEATKARIMKEVHNDMVQSGDVVTVSDEVISDVEEAYPDLRHLKKKDRTQIIKETVKKIKQDLRNFLGNFKDSRFEFKVNGKILDAKLYTRGINEVTDSITQEKAKMLYASREIFERARYLYSTPDYGDDVNIYRWNYFYTPVKIGDETVGVRIAIRDTINPSESQIYHWGIKKDTSLDGVGRDKNRISYGASSDVSDIIIPKNSEKVKENSKKTIDGDKKALPVEEKTFSGKKNAKDTEKEPNVNLQNSLDKESGIRYAKNSTSKTIKYISHSKIGYENVEYIKRQLLKLYSGLDNCIGNGIAIAKDDTIYIVDSSKHNNKMDGHVAVREIIPPNKNKNKVEIYLQEINKEAYENGYVDRELFERLRSELDNNSNSNVGYASRENLSNTSGQSENNEGRVSSDNGDRGVQVLTSDKRAIPGDENSRADKSETTERKSMTVIESAKFAQENVPEYNNMGGSDQARVRRLIRQMKANGFTDRQMRYYARVASRSGIDIVVDKEILRYTDKEGKTRYADGLYSPSKNKIYVNPDGSRSPARLLIHELTHAIYRTADGALILEEGAKKLTEEEKKRIREEYSVLQGEDVEIFEDEYNAHYIEGMLGDEQILERLCREKPSLIEKIISFFKSAVSDYAEDASLSAEAEALYQRYEKYFNEFSERNQYNTVTSINNENMHVTGDIDKETPGVTNTDVDTETRFALPYDDAIDKLASDTLDTAQNTHLRVLEHTPQIYIDKAGASDREIVMSWDIAYLAMNKSGNLSGNYHGLGADVMKAIPAALEDPLYIVKQKNGRIAAVTKIVVKGKRAVFASIELETYQTTIQDGETEAKRYNLVVTVTDAKPNYLQNTIFKGKIVHNKNSEDPAHFILRLKSLEKAVPTYDLAGSSDNSITENAEKSNPSDEKTSKNVSTNSGDRMAIPESETEQTDVRNQYNTVSSINNENMHDTEGKESTNIRFAKSIDSYPYDMQTVIKEYLDSADSNLENFIDDALSETNEKRLEYMHRDFVNDIPQNILNEIKELVGFDVSKFGIRINGECIHHINRMHGEQGKHDHSMQNKKDIARIQYTISNADKAEYTVDSSNQIVMDHQYRNSDNTESHVISITKRINGTYYVVCAVPDSKSRTMHIKSAYISKKEATQEFDAINAPNRTSKTNLEIASKDSISQNTEKSTENSKNVSTNSGDRMAIPETETEQTDVRNQYNTVTKKSEGGERFAFGVTQQEINEYIDNAYEKKNTEDYKEYAVPSQRLINDVSPEIDISDYSHALRDNDIRHIRNSHGENTNEKYPVTQADLQKIPDIVANYDKVFVKTNANGDLGLAYVKVGADNVVYYVEAVTTQYHNKKLLVNKQMVKAGIDEIPNLNGLVKAINKKESSSQYLADLREIREAYVQDVKGNYSNNSISQNTEKSTENSKNVSTNSGDRMAIPESETEQTDVRNQYNTVSSINNENMHDTEGGERYAASDNDFSDHDKPITLKDVETLRNIGRKSINEFTIDDIKKSQKWAFKFYKELGVKSPFFRAWFGEWKAHQTKEKVNIAKIPEYTATNEARKQNRGTVTNNDTKWDIRISREGETNTISHAGEQRLSEYGLSGIRELIENAVLFDSEIHEHHSNNAKEDRITFDHKLYALGKSIDGTIALYRVTVEETYQSYKQPHDKRFHNLKYIEKVADNIGSLTHGQSRGAESTNDVSTTTYSISDLYEFVKTFDKEFTLAPEVNEKLLNKDGSPKVFYHGTDANFTQFNPDEIAAREGSYFFAENREDAAAYGKNIYEVYLSGRKLADYDNQPHEFYQLKNKREQVAWLKERGYDGWYADMDSDGWGEVSVFNPEQIKSATDNIGMFDKSNPDIRYALPDTDTDTVDTSDSNLDNNSGKKYNYTKEQYEQFGWAREVEALSKNELDDLYSKIKARSTLRTFKRSSKGEAIIEVNDKPHTTLGVNNVFVFVKGTKNNFTISRVVRFDAQTEVEMEIYKEDLYEGRACSDTHLALYQREGITREYRREDFPTFAEYRERRSDGEKSRGADQDNRRSEQHGSGYSQTLGENGETNVRYALPNTDTDTLDTSDSVGKKRQQYNASIKERIFTAADSIYIDTVDEMYGVKKYLSKVGKIKNADDIIQAVRASMSASQTMLGDVQYDIFSDDGKKVGEGLSKIMKPITLKGDTVKISFNEYLMHWRNVDSMTLEERTEGKIPNKSIFGENENRSEAVTAEQSHKRIDEIEKVHPDFNKTAEKPERSKSQR